MELQVEKTIILLKTVGDQLGEKKDISELLITMTKDQVSVVSKCQQAIQMHEKKMFFDLIILFTLYFI